MPTVRPDGRESGSISVAEIAVEVAAALDGVPEGTELDPRTAALVELAVVASPTTLHLERTAVALRGAPASPPSSCRRRWSWCPASACTR